MKTQVDAPPKHLSAGARRLWARLRNDFHLDDAAAVALLRCACESFDRAEQCRAQVAADGATFLDRYGQRKVHPLIAAERDARGQLIGALRAMKLAPGDVGDP